jgi:predicted NAD-dependent protein-ADP-ribosyltransferase YbiA (DUF1768 family)
MADVFQFYSSSASAPAPGKGTGESGDPKKYAELQKHEGWRRVLSSSSPTPFVWKGIQWKTAEHAYRAWHLETKNPEVFLSYSQNLSKASPVPNTDVLKEILYEKFTQNPTAKEILLLTGNAELWSTAPKARWTWLEELREDLKRNLQSTEEMSTPAQAKKSKSKVRVSAQGGATMPMFVETPGQGSGNGNSTNENSTPPAAAEGAGEAAAGDTVTYVPLNVRATGVEEKEEVKSSKKSAIRFCSVCDNYLYLQVEGETQTLQRICRNCGFKDTEDQGGLVSEMHIEQRAAEGYTLINEFTLKDKRLPHLHNTMKCINEKCPSSLPGKESDIVYIKYDIENLRYIYMCYICQATWRSRR